MKVAFAGTPEFAAAALEAILAAGFDVPLVLTQPDRPAGRGMQLQPSPVKRVALAAGIPVHQPEKLRTPEQQAPLAAVQADVLVVAAYGIILPQAVLDLPRHGCLNIHASLLPRWRGAAPIQRAIEAGDAETGVCIMQMDAGLDTGAVVSTHRYAIKNTDTATDVHDALADLGAQAIVADLQQLQQTGRLNASPQPQTGITYAQKLSKEEAKIDWNQPALIIERKIRAFTPFPGGAAQYSGETLKIWQAHAQAQAHNAPPGQVLAADAHGVVVACGSGVLCLTQLQRAGGKRLAAADFLRGFTLPVGSQLQRP